MSTLSTYSGYKIPFDLNATVRLDGKCLKCKGLGYSDEFLTESCGNHPEVVLQKFTPEQMDAKTLPCGCAWRFIEARNECPECGGEGERVWMVTASDLFDAFRYMLRQQGAQV